MELCAVKLTGPWGAGNAYVHTGPDEAIIGLTDDGIEELTDMLRGARITTKSRHEFLDDFVHDAELVARIKAQSPR